MHSTRWATKTSEDFFPLQSTRWATNIVEDFFPLLSTRWATKTLKDFSHRILHDAPLKLWRIFSSVQPAVYIERERLPGQKPLAAVHLSSGGSLTSQITIINKYLCSIGALESVSKYCRKDYEGKREAGGGVYLSSSAVAPGQKLETV